MRVKNVSGGPLDVPLLDRQVEADEVVDVPDYQPGHSLDDLKAGRAFEVMPIFWPENRWEPVADEKPKRTGKAVV